MSLFKFLPSVVGAVKILTDQEARKDNDAALSSKAAMVTLGASSATLFSPEQPPEVTILGLLLSVALYFYRRRELDP